MYSTNNDSAIQDDEDDGNLDDDDDIADPLGADSQFERGWSRSWLVALLRKGEDWVNEVQQETEEAEAERNLRMQVIDEAGGEPPISVTITRSLANLVSLQLSSPV